jgi:hypothetical protein
MAAPFNEANIAALSRALMSHAPDYVFTAETLDKLYQETALSVVQIVKWADNVRFAFPTDSRAAWLSGAIDGKVFSASSKK